jgi:ABC-type uncharacterized transport system fused permease/ATPase subunit
MAVNSFAKEGVTWVTNQVEDRVRVNLTNHLLSSYFTNNSFYVLRELDGRIKDPEQRIANDVQEFSEKFAAFFREGIKPLIDVVIYGVRLKMLIGFQGFSAVFLYVLVGFVFVRGFMPNYKVLKERETQLEGKFKFVHSRIAQHSESIAFFGGDDYEYDITEKRAADLWKLRKEKIFKDIKFGIPNQFFTATDSQGSIPQCLKFALQFYYQTLSDHAASGLDGDGLVTLAQNDLIIGHTIDKTLAGCSSIINFAEDYSTLLGVVKRVSEALDVFKNVSESRTGAAAATAADGDTTEGLAVGREDSISFEAVDIVTPAGECLAQDLSLSISRKTPLMVTGASAAGKTSFFRVLSGLWKSEGRGIVQRPTSGGNSDIFFVPQRIYMVTGSLADQVRFCLLYFPFLEHGG